MYKLLRRISSSFTGRIDRTREEDAVASQSMPQAGSKRRMSDDDEEQNGSLSKRSRAHDESRPDEFGSEISTPVRDESEPPASSSMPASALPRKDTEEVRQVTKGVKEVELEDKKGKGKEVVNEAVEDELKAEVAADGDEEEPSEDPKTDEAHEDETVADEESNASDAEGSVVSEPSKDESPEPVAVSATSDATEASSESEVTQGESADTNPITDVKEIKVSDSTPSTPPIEGHVTNAQTIPEPLVSGASDEITAKA